ncbi:MAG TPA: hypothetical protein VFL91_28455 [Thermomicrobiales bacterium]|nr:hypothetical protein [Thermomicrobiales bacterium]
MSARPPDRARRALPPAGGGATPFAESRRARQVWDIATKVPQLTAYFWIIKILTTAMGEATSDYLVHRFDPIIAVLGGFVGLLAALALQFWTRRYVAWVYWLAAVMVSIFGTMAADVLHVGFGVPYAVSAAFFAVALVVIFLVWYWRERTLSIHTVHTPLRELFYWAAVCATFALGTATGDLTAYTLHLGFFASGLLFAVLFAAPAVACWLGGLNPITAFWLSYIVTRPLGASFADWGAKPTNGGGLGLGDELVALVLTLLIVGFVAYLSVTHEDIADEPAVAVAAPRG